MKYTIYFSAVLLFVFPLFITLDTHGQNFNENNLQQYLTEPVWIREVTNLNVIRDIDIDSNGDIHISNLGVIMKYNQDGTQAWIQNPALYNDFDIAIYTIIPGINRLYTSEGPGPYIDELAPERYGAIGISTYGLDGNILRTMLFADNVSSSFSPGFIVDLNVDNVGNIYIIGVYDDYLLFGSDTLRTFNSNPESVYTDVFLISYGPDGALRWNERIGARDDFDTIMVNCSIYPGLPGVFTVDGHGNTYFVGCFSKGAVLGEGQPGEVSLLDSELALVSFDSEGNFGWLRTYAGLGIKFDTDNYRNRSLLLEDITVDTEGNIFSRWLASNWLTSDPGKPIVFGNTAFIASGNAQAFLVKHASNGDILWARHIAGNDHNIISDFTTDSQGDIYITGEFNSAVLRLGKFQLFNYDNYEVYDMEGYNELDGFVARYDANGDLLWVAHATGPGAQYITDIAIAPSGDIYIAGYFWESLQLGSEELTLEGNDSSVFLAKYAASTITSSEAAAELPTAPMLTSNYPNPFTNRTTIEYALPASGPVRLAVYDALGREVATLVNGVRQAGAHVAVFDGSSLPSGVYLYRLEAAGQAETGLMTLRK